MSKNIGILSTCIGAEKLYQGHTSEDEQIANRLRTVRPNWCFKKYRAYAGEFPDQIDSCDGYVISGSPASVNAQDDWVGEILKYIRSLYASGHPLFGICFGHQAIALALGGKVELSQSGWSLGSIKVHFNGRAPWMNPRKAVTRLYAIHNEQVVTPPSGAEILGHANNCPIASFRIGNHIFTTQHHPEITPDFMSSVVEYMALELDGEVIRRAKASLEFEVDNDSFAEWMAKFLEGKTKDNRKGNTFRSI